MSGIDRSARLPVKARKRNHNGQLQLARATTGGAMLTEMLRRSEKIYDCRAVFAGKTTVNRFGAASTFSVPAIWSASRATS